MRLSQETLNSMAREDYRALENRMCAWAAAAEAELQSGEKPREILFDLLFWANGEFMRRRCYMELEQPETELHARQVMRALAERMREEEEREP